MKFSLAISAVAVLGLVAPAMAKFWDVPALLTPEGDITPKAPNYVESSLPHDVYLAYLDGCKEIPTPITNESANFGTAIFELLLTNLTLSVSLSFSGDLGNITKLHLHGPANDSSTAPPIYDLLESKPRLVSPIAVQVALNETTWDYLVRGLLYINIHNDLHPDGALRGQVGCVSSCRVPHGSSSDDIRFFAYETCNPDRRLPGF
ncbi:uncharacterized protein BJ171DRAFT_485020 [Polychytrium aggregatum]|uniref:uncharacterized protein n=1 Tax=Polychytrium aggregatum TaxID=110093 RepID=UPI0022FE8DB2|nr:uncharacterized protein BJ171DRAFT_485020 [Polychytrium aggregatum]KAI9209782.1 hypothetical protein BJ171DRAFT_485020 [Polychytrium aggregatum]